jgi:hypothetical protein
LVIPTMLVAELESAREEFPRQPNLSRVSLAPPSSRRNEPHRGIESPPEAQPNAVAITITSPGGLLLATLPLAYRTERPSNAAVIVYAQDATASLSVTIQVDFAGPGQFNLMRSARRDTLPASILPTLRLLTQFKPPNFVSFQFDDGDSLPPIAIPTDPELVSPELLDVVERLEYIQRKTDTFFYIPDELSSEDIATMRRAERLLRGHRVGGTWSAMSVVLQLKDKSALDSMRTDEFSLMVEANEEITIGGHVIRLGRSRRHLLSARMTGWEGEAGQGRLTLAPGTLNEFETWLVGIPGDRDDVIPGISSSFRDLLDQVMDENDEVLRRLAL